MGFGQHGRFIVNAELRIASHMRGAFTPIDYSTGPTVHAAVAALTTGRPVLNQEQMKERKKYSRPSFAEVRAQVLRKDEPAFHTRQDEQECARIKASIYQSRGLEPASGCLPVGVVPAFAQGSAGPALGVFLTETDDTEGGGND